MKNMLKKVNSDKSKFKRVLFSVVVLTLLFVVSITAVNAWVETISTILITGYETIDSPIYTNATVNSDASVAIDLTKYFKEAGNAHLSEASSADGVNFYFPVVDSTGTTKYRQGNINDICVNYISFTFKVKSADANAFVFNTDPIIKIGSEEVTDSSVRVAVTLDGVTKIFSKQASTAEVVSDKSGTTSSTEVLSFADYIYENENNNVVFNLDAETEKELTVSIWLQENIATELSGKEVSISNMSLIPDVPRYKIEATAVTNENEKDATGGTVKINSTNADAYAAENVEIDSSVTLTAALTSDDYIFSGWYDAEGTKVSSNLTYTFTADKDYHFYAKFATAHKVIAYAVIDGDTTYANYNSAVTVRAGTSAAAQTSQYTTASGSTVSVVAARSNQNYRFMGWYDAPTGGNALTYTTSSNTYTTTVTATEAVTKVYARFTSQYLVTAYAVTDGTSKDATGGTVKVGSAAVAASSASYVLKGNPITVVATVKDGYSFDGWYSSAADPTQSPLSTDLSYKIENITAAKNVYARFTSLNYTVNAYAVIGDSTTELGGGTVSIDGGTAGTSAEATVPKTDTSVKLKAVSADDYSFEGWYDSNGKLLSESEEFTYSDASDLKAYARFKEDANYIYLKTVSDWDKDDNWFAAYFFGNDDTWVKMETVVDGSIYKVKVPDGYTSVIFCRMNSADTTTLGWGNVWNQTEDLDLPDEGSANNMFTITTAFQSNNKANGSWGAYSAD